MASLSEMLNYANVIQTKERQGSNSGRIARLLESGLTGAIQGEGHREQMVKDRFDHMVKIIDVQEKLANIEKAQQAMEIEGNFAKSLGLLPHSPDEKGNARAVAFDNLGGPEARAGRDNTQGARLSDMFNLENYDAVPGFSSKGGLSVSFKRKPGSGIGSKGAAQLDTHRQRVYNLAVKMATSETADEFRRKGQQPEMFARITPRQDVIEKYLPIAENYFSGDKKGYETLVKKRKAALFPLGVLPGMADEESTDLTLDNEEGE